MSVEHKQKLTATLQDLESEQLKLNNHRREVQQTLHAAEQAVKANCHKRSGVKAELAMYARQEASANKFTGSAFRIGDKVKRREVWGGEFWTGVIYDFQESSYPNYKYKVCWDQADFEMYIEEESGMEAN